LITQSVPTVCPQGFLEEISSENKKTKM